MQWTDCEMVWRRVSGWQERRQVLPEAAKPAHSLLGPAPAVCWSCPGGTGGRSGGQNKEMQLCRLVSVWSKWAPWVEDRSRLLPVGSAVFLEGNRQRQCEDSGLFMFGWLFLLHSRGPISNSPTAYPKYAYRHPGNINIKWFFFLFKWKQCTVHHKTQMLVYSR